LKKSKLLSVVLSVLLALCVLTGAIAAPLLCRAFYYVQIGPLGLVGESGLTADEIRAAFDAVMDYCLGLRPDFSAGVLPFSAEGASHFADVRTLFLLDLRLLALSLLLLGALALWMRARRLRAHRFLGRGPGFYAACGLGVLFLALAIPCAIDFDWAFAAFHALFFPGKDNWLFNPATDPVIRILPQRFFLHSALLILALLLLGCGVLLWTGRRRRDAH